MVGNVVYRIVALANASNNAGGSLYRIVANALIAWLGGAERGGEGGGSGVPWEVKVVGADIKWLVGPSGLGWYFKRELDDMSKGRREKCLGDDGLVVLRWASCGGANFTDTALA
jgi:hypothetical protein